MTSNASSDKMPAPAGSKPTVRKSEGQPDWTNGLRRLYNSVVEEDLPDSFKDLLSQLDTKD